MAQPKVYTRKSDATRAAKKEFGEHWADSVEIFEREGGFVYDFPRKAAGEEAAAAIVGVQELLAQNAAEIKEKAAKAKKIKANKPIHTPATPESSPAQGPVSELAPESGNEPADDHIDPLKDQAVAISEALKAADREADAALVNVDPLKPRVSIVDRPTKLVWDIADNMPGKKRSEVIAECVSKGIAYGTARTQYQHWFKQKAVSAAEPRATLDTNGKIIPAAKQ